MYLFIEEDTLLVLMKIFFALYAIEFLYNFKKYYSDYKRARIEDKTFYYGISAVVISLMFYLEIISRYIDLWLRIRIDFFILVVLLFLKRKIAKEKWDQLPYWLQLTISMVVLFFMVVVAVVTYWG